MIRRIESHLVDVAEKGAVGMAVFKENPSRYFMGAIAVIVFFMFVGFLQKSEAHWLVSFLFGISYVYGLFRALNIGSEEKGESQCL